MRGVPGEPTLKISVGSRLHMGLFNESGLYGRIDGGAGLALEEPNWSLELLPSSFAHAEWDSSANSYAQDLADRICILWDLPRFQVRITHRVPSHVGLGAKTGLAMGIGYGLAKVARRKLQAGEVASLVRRGGTSGVGVHLASRGGFVVDDGHEFPTEKGQYGPSSRALGPPPGLVAALIPPEEWRVIHLRVGTVGLSGAAEIAFFDKYCPVPESETREILLLSGQDLMPGFVQRDLNRIHGYLDDVQGLGLKKCEWLVQDKSTLDLRERWRHARKTSMDLAPLALSSMGPTCFLLTNDPQREMRQLASLGIPRTAVTLTRIRSNGVAFERGENVA